MPRSGTRSGTPKTSPEKLERLRATRQKLLEDKVCLMARSHGPATHGTMCERCYLVQRNSNRRRAGLPPLPVPMREPYELQKTMAFDALVRSMAARIHIQPFRREVEAEYVPMDSLDDWPMKVMRQLRFFGWVAQPDLRDALEASSEHDRNAVSSAITRMVRAGFVEREWRTHRWAMRGTDNCYWFRLTQSGRAELARRIARLNEFSRATDEEIAEHDAELAQYEGRIDPQTLQPLRRAA